MQNLLKKKYLLGSILLVFLFSGCEIVDTQNDTNDSNDKNTTQQIETIDTPPDNFYKYSAVSDDKGYANVSSGLKALNYIDNDSNTNYVVEVLNRDEEPLSNMEIEYTFDDDKIYLKIIDANNNFNTLYQVKDYNLSSGIENDVSAQNIKGNFIGLVFRVLSRAFMRAKQIYTVVDGVDTAYSLYNVDISYVEIEDDIVFEGTIKDFYTFFDATSSLIKLPLAYKNNLKNTNNNISARGAIQLTKENKSEIVQYLKDITGYLISESDTKIKLVLHRTDGIHRIGSIDVIIEPILEEKNDSASDDTSSNDTQNNQATNKYDLTVSITGEEKFNFDTLGNAPDFKGWIIINTSKYEVVKKVDSFTNIQIIEDIDVDIGENIEVIIVDEDLLFDDEVNRFNFIFNGTKHIATNNISTVTLDFTEQSNTSTVGIGSSTGYTIDTIQTEQNTISQNNNIYNMNVAIKGLSNYSYDAFGNLPDFKGTIIIKGKSFEIIEKSDSLQNSKTFNNIEINYGENISVEIVDVDIVFDDDMIEFNELFTGKNISKSNNKVVVDITFTK